MNISEEQQIIERYLNELRKINPSIGHYIEAITPPLHQGTMELLLTNGVIKIRWSHIYEFNRLGKNKIYERMQQDAFDFTPSQSK